MFLHFSSCLVIYLTIWELYSIISRKKETGFHPGESTIWSRVGRWVEACAGEPFLEAAMDKLVVGWIGTGIMGTSMCSHLIDAGFSVNVFNRTIEKTAALAKLGAQVCLDPADVTRRSDAIFTMVDHPKSVRDVYFGENGCLSVDVKGKILVDMTTTEPKLAKEIFQAAREKGAAALDAPVSGGDRGAREATLSIMVGGDEATYGKVRPLFRIMGKSIILEGGAGAGQHTKMANQIVISGTMIGVCEAMVYARRAGLDVSAMLKTISGGAAGCWTLDNLAPRVLNGDFAPGFMIDHFVKDMKIAIEEAQAMGLKLDGLELVCRIYRNLQEDGHGREGTQALVKAIDKEAFR